jgi:hypothetical protein
MPSIELSKLRLLPDKCLLLALFGHPIRADECPLLGGKRTWRGRDATSAFDPKRTQGRRRLLGSAESHLDKLRYASCFS